jgi:hypothetical protein
VINYEPSLTLALDEECRTQVRIGTESRTNAFQVPPAAFDLEWRQAVWARRMPDSMMHPGVRANGMRLFHVLLDRKIIRSATLQYPYRQDYFRQLYSLLFMLRSLAVLPNGSLAPRAVSPLEARELAQWAANILEFRDPDSTISRYDYDPDLSNGWQPPFQTVFGFERPEILITETLAYDYPNTPNENSAGRKFYLQLHRPWSASIRHEGVDIPTERIDPNLAPPVTADNAAANILDLGKTVPGTQDPIWRVVLRSQSGLGQIAPAQPPSNVLNEPPQAGQVTYQVFPLQRFVLNGGLRVGPNSTLIIEANPTLLFVDPESRLPGQAGALARARNTDMVYLQRLADPTRPFALAGNANPYVVVDRAPVFVNVDGLPQAVGDPVPNVRDHSFWKQAFASGPGRYLPDATPSQSGDWLHWPNRDYIGHAELRAVPGGAVLPAVVQVDDQGTMRQETLWLDHLQSLARYPDASLASADLLPEILDATIVPSRFMGSAMTVGDPRSRLAPTGFQDIPCNQLSRWREPGRVNINTVRPNPANEPAQPLRPKRSLVEHRARAWPESPPAPPPLPTVPGPIPNDCDPLPRSIDNAAVNALLGIDADPIAPAPVLPARTSLAEMLLSSAINSGQLDPRRKSTGLQLAEAIRLSNVATVRSNVFAVWVTLKTENTMTGDSRTRRVFAIVDRSIPVGYWPGVDLNTSDTIRLKRFLE